MTSHDEFDDAAAAYALNALDSSERDQFDLHLATCERCQRTVAEWRDVTAALGASVEPVEPPASLKARTIAHATAQAQAPVAASISRLVPRASLPSLPSAKAPSSGAAPRSSEWLVRAASVIIIAGLGLYSASLRSEVATLRGMVADATERAEQLRGQVAGLRGDSARLSHAMSVVSAPDTVRVELRGAANAPRATGRAFFSRDRGLILAANQLPPLAPGRVYQLWVIPPDSSVALSGGVFSVDGTGALPEFVATLPAGLRSVKTIAITDEPGPVGSPSGTTPILLVGSAGD